MNVRLIKIDFLLFKRGRRETVFYRLLTSVEMNGTLRS